MLKIGNVKIKNKIVLAPMAGISNPAYMRICEEMGVGYVVTELISSEAVFRNNKKTLEMLNGIDKICVPYAIQIFGSNPLVMAKAAKYLCDNFNPSVIDINAGCPVPKVASRAGAGSGLLKDPYLLGEIVKAVCEAVDVPVSVKIRSGWDFDSINAVSVAKICEEAGASLITVHGRTRSQGYSGKASLDVIKKVKENVSIPVIGNGDIRSPEDALNMLQYTGCDAVMIGRGLLGNPWLIKNCVNYLDGGSDIITPTISDKVNMMKKHLNYLLEDKPERIAILEMRTLAAHYLKGVKGSTSIKQDIFKAQTKEEFLNIINKLK